MAVAEETKEAQKNTNQKDNTCMADHLGPSTSCAAHTPAVDVTDVTLNVNTEGKFVIVPTFQKYLVLSNQGTMCTQ